jgi:hypothetical protein
MVLNILALLAAQPFAEAARRGAAAAASEAVSPIDPSLLRLLHQTMPLRTAAARAAHPARQREIGLDLGQQASGGGEAARAVSDLVAIERTRTAPRTCR